MKKLITPVLTPIVDGRVDAEALIDLIYEISSSVDEIVILGTTGGGHEHSMEICSEVLEVCATLRDMIQIRVGIIREDAEESIQLIEEALNLGYEHFMVGAPEDKEEDVDFWESVGEATSEATTVLLYNRPGLAPIPHGTIDQIGDLFDGIKDSSGDKEEFLRLLEYRDGDFGVFLGDESIAEGDPEILKQCSGIISGSSNVPDIADLFKRWVRKPNDEKVLGEIRALKAKIAALDADYRVALMSFITQSSASH